MQIIGTGSHLPEQILTNEQLEGMVETSDEWITERTGIRERRICGDTPVYRMGALAGIKALEQAGVSPGEVDMIIGVTMTPDYFTPSMACLVQKELGADRAFCFDLNAACSGFAFALDTADSYIKSGKAETILIVAAEALSKIVDYTDRNTCILFGDGAGAVVVRKGTRPGLLGSCLYSDGAGGDVLTAPVFSPKPYLQMAGKEVYRFAVGACARVMETLLSQSGLSAADIRHVVSHQANSRIISAVAAKLGADPGRFFMNLDKYGNTSGASIPICLDEMNRSGMLLEGERLILIGFGGGLTYGGALIEWRLSV